MRKSDDPGPCKLLGLSSRADCAVSGTDEFILFQLLGASGHRQRPNDCKLLAGRSLSS